jgi:hypothetical protein
MTDEGTVGVPTCLRGKIFCLGHSLDGSKESTKPQKQMGLKKPRKTTPRPKRVPISGGFLADLTNSARRILTDLKKTIWQRCALLPWSSRVTLHFLLVSRCCLSSIVGRRSELRCPPHIGREAEVVKNKFPSIGMVPKCCIFDGLSYETCFGKIGRYPKFKLQFFVLLYVFLL